MILREIFSMKKIALFPVQKNNAPLARYQNRIPDTEVIPILAPAHKSMAGQDLSALDGGSHTGITLRGDFEKAVEDCELLYLDDSRFLTREESYAEFIRTAERHPIRIVYARTLSERLHLQDEESCSQKWQASGLGDAGKLTAIDVPVISILTMGNETDQSHVEIGMRRFFQDQGYRVSQIGTQEYSRLFGFSAVPHFLFANLDGKRKRLMFNQFVRRMIKEEKPDLLIMGVPEAVMKYNNRIPAGMGDVPCIMMDAVQSDIGVLCTCCQPYTEEYFKELSLFGRYRLNCELHYFNISNSVVINDEDYQDRLEHLPLDSGFVVSHMYDGVDADCGFEIFNSYSDMSSDKAYRRMEEELAGNPEAMRGGI